VWSPEGDTSRRTLGEYRGLRSDFVTLRWTSLCWPPLISYRYLRCIWYRRLSSVQVVASSTLGGFLSHAYLVAGLAYGDEGKGATVDYLVRTKQAQLVVRYNGGAQAAHNVVTADGRHHTFAQFGSGTLVPGVGTHLSRFMIVNPDAMLNEEQHLQQLGITDAFSRTTIEDKAVVVTPFHRAINRLMEWSREDPHGSCGMGIGQARSDHLQYGNSVLFVGDLRDEQITERKLEFIHEKAYTIAKTLQHKKFRNRDTAFEELSLIYDRESVSRIMQSYWHFTSKANIVDSGWLKHFINRYSVTVFEGAQGMLLDEKYGQAPYNTWTDCTYNNAISLLNEGNFRGRTIRVGVLRSYFTRHGAGPFNMDHAMTRKVRETHNTDDCFQGQFKVGPLNVGAIQYSLKSIGGVNWIAINHLDQYFNIPREISPLIKLVSFGPTAADRKEWDGQCLIKI